MSSQPCQTDKSILLIFPKWPARTIWGHFRFKFPALGILTIAGATPPEYDIEFVDENVQELSFDTQAALVAISVMTPLAARAYELADRFRAMGKTVVLGGIHVSCCPEEAAAHADAIVVGEGENAWRRLLADYEAGALGKRYHEETFLDLTDLPSPRRDLMGDQYPMTGSTIQLTRGCPFDCEYCSVTAFFGRRFRMRPLDGFVEEFCSLPGRFIFIVDDNIVSRRSMAMELFGRLRGSGKWWGSQAPITVADDDELLRTMAESGCKQLFIGFESLKQDNLDLMGKNFVDVQQHAARIRKIQDYGIGIQGSFIVGYDYDDEGVFDGLYDFITGTRMESFLISVLTPFPGIRLTDRLEAEGRILSRDWSLYDMNTVVFKPLNVTPEDLQDRYNTLNKALYAWPSVLKRSLKLSQRTIICLPQNIGFREAWCRMRAARETEDSQA